jgi:catechol 2,3-dioxygenase-like lactoylglutathione lyase family enzyme
MTIALIDPGSSSARLPRGMRLGPVQLTLSDLERSLDWYARSLGLGVHHREAQMAALGDGVTSVIELIEDPTAAPAGRWPTPDLTERTGFRSPASPSQSRPSSPALAVLHHDRHFDRLARVLGFQARWIAEPAD